MKYNISSFFECQIFQVVSDLYIFTVHVQFSLFKKQKKNIVESTNKNKNLNIYLNGFCQDVFINKIITFQWLTTGSSVKFCETLQLLTEKCSVVHVSNVLLIL